MHNTKAIDKKLLAGLLIAIFTVSWFMTVAPSCNRANDMANMKKEAYAKYDLEIRSANSELATATSKSAIAQAKWQIAERNSEEISKITNEKIEDYRSILTQLANSINATKNFKNASVEELNEAADAFMPFITLADEPALAKKLDAIKQQANTAFNKWVQVQQEKKPLENALKLARDVEMDMKRQVQRIENMSASPMGVMNEHLASVTEENFHMMLLVGLGVGIGADVLVLIGIMAWGRVTSEGNR